MNIVITGSIAYDYLMTFPGSFTDHILPDQLERISLSFLVDGMERRRGGCAPNVAYTLALLGERPTIMATAGQDFGDYRQWLESHGVDTSLVRDVPGKFTASFFCNTDQKNNQIASFYTGAMADAGSLSFADAPRPDLVIISPNDPAAMVSYARECRALGIPFIYDPGQQCARSSADELRAGLEGAFVVIVNDYELELIRQKTGLSEDAILDTATALIVTRGEKGSTILLKGQRLEIPVVPEERVIDPTGVGDSYRGGLLKGLAVGADWETCGRLGSVAATYALEHVGGQGHAFTWAEFKARYAAHFGPLNLD
ncbi:MAG: carbohydrate kinase family protein [Thermoflexales bacterium]|nr:carbohydrate kinase family protein [Thermoflexales bacterium]MBP8241277.1 carbohydrate kinase family protein [Thermoflexales bacterium]